MARMPRLVVPVYPHPVTQRGDRRMKTFFCEDDYLAYPELMSDAKVEEEARPEKKELGKLSPERRESGV